jgi:asparagine synthase (glutamine-hydrolysing)
MCGINGFISHRLSNNERLEIVRKMNSALAHRGPDNEGTWGRDDICFGHRRLSIIDLSEEGNQPFISPNERYVIVYNGELYNYRDLKLQLQRAEYGSQRQPYIFKTESDTEVVLASYIRWGSKCLEYFNGMFAFAVYDKESKSLFVARDRIGVKPLYYYSGEEGFIFSSEVRGILHSGIRKFSLNNAVIDEYLMYQTVFAPSTIVKDIHMLMPGHFAEVKNEKIAITKYYSVNKVQHTHDVSGYSETCNKVHDLLAQSVQRRMIADVPFGAFLSGGIDSSAVVALMSKVSANKINTFNVSFDETEFSESAYARLIAKKFNTTHHEIRLTPSDFLKLLPEALAAMDHPSGDGPNTYVVSKATKQAGITMALSGIGGDELFAGYDVFKRMVSLDKKPWLNAIPVIARKTAGSVIRSYKDTVSGNKIAELLGQQTISFDTAYPLSRTVFTLKELSLLVKKPHPFKQITEIMSQIPQAENHLLSAVSLAEINSYLTNTLLRDTDQMSMAVALEIREPFLDYKLIEFVLGINDAKKYPHTPKKLLVDSLGGLLPPEVVNRPKMGFTLPWQQWLKGELKSFCEKNILEFCEFEFCNKEGILSLWQQFLSNNKKVTWSRIWHIVVLNYWIRKNKLA